MAFPEKPRIIFKKNPLDKVICQLRFPPILKIDAEIRADFQETDSRIVQQTLELFATPHLREKVNYSLVIPVSQHQTIGSSFNNNFFPLTTEDNIIDNALATLQTQSGLPRGNYQEAIRETKKFLFKIQGIISEYLQYGFDFSNFPPLHNFFVDDGSILIEWIFEDYRIGFNFEQAIRESSWYLVSNREFGEISASGYLSDIEAEKLIAWLLNFVLVNFESS